MLSIRIIISIALTHCLSLSLLFSLVDTWKTRLFNGNFCYYLQPINKRAFIVHNTEKEKIGFKLNWMTFEVDIKKPMHKSLCLQLN